MAISTPGVGSGLDVNSIVTQLMNVEREPLRALDKKEASFQAKLSAFGALKGAVSSLKSAATALKDPAAFQKFKTTVADTSLLTGSGGSTASAGTYDVEVVNLATAHKLRTSDLNGFASATSVLSTSAGQLTFQLGTGTAFTVDVSANATLTDLRDAINAKNGSISASIVNAGGVNGYRLILSGKDTGTANTISVTNANGNTDFDKFATANLTSVQGAANATIKVDGITLSKASNSVTDAIDGVTLTLVKGNPGTTTKVTVAKDDAALKSAADALAKSYNDFAKTARDLTKYDAASKRGGVLLGDGTVRSIQSQLRDAVGGVLSGTTDTSFDQLADVGFSFDRSGNLVVDSTKLQKALDTDRDKTVNLISGVGARLEKIADGIQGTGGAIAAKTDGINASIKSIGNQRDRLVDRLADTETRLRRQYASLDALVAGMNQTSNFLTQQLSRLSS